MRFILFFFISLNIITPLYADVAQNSRVYNATINDVMTACEAALFELAGSEISLGKSANWLYANGIQARSPGEFDSYILRTDWDEKWDTRWVDAKYDVEVFLKSLDASLTEIKVSCKFRGFGMPFNLLTLPAIWYERPSSGRLEAKFFNLVQEKIDEIEKFGRILPRPDKIRRVPQKPPTFPITYSPPWTPNENLIKTPDTPATHNWQNEVGMAVGKRGSGRLGAYASWNEYRYEGTTAHTHYGFARSTNGGLSWLNDTILGHNAGGYLWQFDPSVCVGNGDTVYAVMQSYNSSSATAIFVLRSTDMGRTWSNPVQASDPGTSEDKPWSTADGRYVYVTWTRFSGTPTQIRFARSTDGGQTWGNYTNLHTTGQTAQWSIPAVGRGDTVYVSWSLDDRNTSGWTVGWDPYVKISTDRGVTWGAEYPSPRANNYRASGTGGSFRWRHLPYSGFAVSKKTGHLHRAYTTRDSSTGVYRIRYTRSTDAGRTWSTPFRLNSTMTPDTFEAFFPWIAVDDSVGHIHVVWYDMRAGRPDSSLDVYYRRSTDGGTTWLPELRVTDVSFWPDTLPSGGFAAIIGDYINVATSTDFAVAGWCDCRNERQGRKEDVYVSRYGYLVDIKEGKKQALETDFILSPCRPNPSRGLVKIQFTNPVTADLSLKVFDLCGNVVRTLIEGTVKEGTNRVMWDGRDDNNVEVPQGVYFIRLKTDKATRIDKITIVK